MVEGGYGKDSLEGGRGGERMGGGLGNDVYDVENVNERVREGWGEGRDRI